MSDYTPPEGKFWRGEEHYHWDLPFTVSLTPKVMSWQRHIEIGFEAYVNLVDDVYGDEYEESVGKSDCVSLETLEDFSAWLQSEIERIKAEFPPQKTAEEIAAIEKIDREALRQQRNSPPSWSWKD
jgi:uncharacterized small protein (DUF1192 family)